MKLSFFARLIIKIYIGILLIIVPNVAFSERIKELVNIQGVRDNQVMGYGLVVGLEGTGDQPNYTSLTNHSILNMMQQMGLNMPRTNNPNLRSKNVAAVMVTGNLEAFAQPGQTIDVTVASIGTARSLRGGTLLMTPLKGADGQIYAMAQGNLTSSHPPVAGTHSSTNAINAVKIPMTIVDGATVERAVSSEIGEGDTINLELKNTDFSLAGKVVDAINFRFGFSTAQAKNAKVISVKVPFDHRDRVNFIGEIESLNVSIDSSVPKVVVNERTGSVVINQEVTLDACAVTYGNISVVVSENPIQIETVPSPKAKLKLLQAGVLLVDVVNALNGIGATPQDLLVILQSMKAAGALHAEIVVI